MQHLPSIFFQDQKLLWAELAGKIHRREVALLIGTGISMASCVAEDQRWVSWKGLIENGLDRCLAYKLMDPELKKTYSDLLKKGRGEDIIRVGEAVQESLTKGKAQGRFQKWLDNTVGKIRLKDPAIIHALKAWEAPFFTTNYDNVLEQVTTFDDALIDEGNLVEEALQKQRQVIVHMHGYFEKADSVVLGLRSYFDLSMNPKAKNLIQHLFNSFAVVLLGCGLDGIQDPTFTELRNWLEKVAKDSPREHYMILPAGECARAQEILDHPFCPLNYGENHGDLLPVLQFLPTLSVSGAMVLPGSKNDSKNQAPKYDPKLVAQVKGLLQEVLKRHTASLPGLGKILGLSMEDSGADVPAMINAMLSMQMDQLFIVLVKPLENPAVGLRLPKQLVLGIVNAMLGLVMPAALIESLLKKGTENVDDLHFNLNSKSPVVAETVAAGYSGRLPEWKTVDGGDKGDELIGKFNVRYQLETCSEPSDFYAHLSQCLRAHLELKPGVNEASTKARLQYWHDMELTRYIQIEKKDYDTLKLQILKAEEKLPALMVFIVQELEANPQTEIKVGTKSEAWLKELISRLLVLPDNPDEVQS